MVCHPEDKDEDQDKDEEELGAEEEDENDGVNDDGSNADVREVGEK